MKHLIFSLFLFVSISVIAQKDLARITDHDFHEHDETKVYVGPKRNEFIRDHNISSKTTVRHVGKFTSTETIHYTINGYALKREYENSSGYISTETFSYDASDRLLSKQTVNSRGEIVNQVEYAYNSAGKTTLIAEKYANVNSIWVYDYDQNGNRVYESGTDRKGKAFIRKKIFDLTSNKILVSELYEKDSLIATKRLEYSYYSDGSKKSIQYFEKDKLVHTWNFDCAPDGQLVNLKKTDSTLVCIKKEIDAEGNEVVWRHEFNSSGEPVKIKSVYDSKGKMKEELSYRADGSIHTQKIFFEDGGFLDLYYDKKGKPGSSTESFCNTKGQMIKLSTTYSKKYFKHIWYSYNEQGLISLLTEVSKKRTIVEEYTYTFFE